MNFEEKFASVGGCEIQYRVAGVGEPVVMLHGAGGFRNDPRAFEGIAEHFRLLVPSLPGFDQSSAGTAASVIDIADVMAEFIRSVAGGSANVIGESFGGGVSTWLAIRHPDVVTRLVLAAPAGLRQEGGPPLLGLSPAEMAVILYGQAPTVQPTPEEAERRGKNRQNAGRLGSARPGFDPELLAQLPLVKAPTLVVWGTADKMIWPSQAHYFVEGIPDARLASIEGGPHVLSAVVPDAFLEVVLEFLRSGAAAAPATAATSGSS
jgi:pimeloyl-ACP methyl ester carboxylesterase